MSKKIEKLPTFEMFEKEKKGETDGYDPPKYLVQPAPDDTGFYMFKKAFDNQKKYFQPRIASSNKDLEENKDQLGV